VDIAKKEALKLITGLPEQASWDDIMYQLYSTLPASHNPACNPRYSQHTQSDP